jgi:type II secretory pathway component GspD/PulD (secretin)
MSYSNIKRFLSVALLTAFTAPSVLALTAYDYAYTSEPSRSSMMLSGDVRLTDKNGEITLSLRDSDVRQVLRMFADKAGMNIIFHNSVEGKVTLDLVKTPINDAFNLVLQVAGLNYYKQGNTMIIMSKNSADNAAYSKQEMLVFPVRYVNASKIAEFLNKNVFGMKKTGLSGVDAATVNSATNELIVFGMNSDIPIIEKVIAQFDREPYTKTFAVNHTTPAEMANMICDVLLPSRGVVKQQQSSTNSSSTPADGGVPTGGAAGMMTGAASSSGGESSSSSDASSLKLGEGILACSVSNATSGTSVAPFDVQNLSIAYFPQRGTITLMGGSEAQAKMIENFIKSNDIKQPQAMLELSIIELNEQGSKEFQNNWQIQSKAWGAHFDGTSTSGGRPGGISGNYMDSVDYAWNGPNGSKDPYITDDGTVTLPEQISRTYKALMPATTYISWQINYLIENRKARVLANPKIMITSGQESVIDLTQDYIEKVTAEYLTSSVTGTGTTGTAQKDYSISDDLGIKVSLVPFISPEGYVTMNIKPEYSTVAEQVYSSGEVSGTSDLVATLLSRRNLDLKNIRIKDGETMVIGGMIQESEQKTVNKIPFLGDLPLVGSAFRSSVTTKAKSELIIMITPKIINDGENSVADTL